jgi:hypothetical protein
VQRWGRHISGDVNFATVLVSVSSTIFVAGTVHSCNNSQQCFNVIAREQATPRGAE